MIWKDILKHLAEYHIISQFGIKTKKVEGADSGVHNPYLSSQKTFFLEQGTLVVYETSATHTSFQGSHICSKKSVAGFFMSGGGVPGIFFSNAMM